jgi:hypothetical protein
MNKLNNSLNTLFILSSALILILCFWSRTGTYAFISTINYISLFALAATILSLPDFLCHYFPSKDKWYRSSEFYTFFLIILLGAAGTMLSVYSFWLGIIILPIGISLAFWELYHFSRSKYWLTLIPGLAVMGYVILLFYTRTIHSTLYPEQIILGKAFIDILFHSSMSNMFSTLGWVSTGLDGSPFVHYHFGSHILFAGLKNWADLNTVMFYIIAYPAIFIPLFFKSLFCFINRLFIYKGTNSFNLLFAISFIAVIYSATLANFNFAQPFISESMTLSLIFSFLYAVVLLSYIPKPGKNENLFFFFSLVALVLISSTKISTGFVCFIGTCYLYLRKYNSFKKRMLLFIGIILTASYIYLFIVPFDILTSSPSLFRRIFNLWSSESFIISLAGAFIAIVVLMKYNSLETWIEIKSVIKSREYLDLEVLLIMTVSSFTGATVASAHPYDVNFFISVQLFFSIPFLIYYCQRYFNTFTASKRIKTLFLISLILLSFVSRPAVFKMFTEATEVKNNMLRLSQQQKEFQGFLIELFKLEKEPEKETICVYIPDTEQWYYESQSTTPLGSPMVVPAITGIALIGGIPDNIYASNYNYYSLYYYKINGLSQVKNISEAKERAAKKGYSKLIEYQYIEGNLIKQEFELKKQHSSTDYN